MSRILFNVYRWNSDNVREYAKARTKAHNSIVTEWTLKKGEALRLTYNVARSVAQRNRANTAVAQ